MFKFSNLPEDVVGIIKIAEKIEIDGIEKKSSGPLQQSGLSQNMSQCNEQKKLGPSNQDRGQIVCTTPTKVATNNENHLMLETTEVT